MRVLFRRAQRRRRQIHGPTRRRPLRPWQVREIDQIRYALRRWQSERPRKRDERGGGR
ncbi:hypothetical protein C5N14_03975 [Micromonospora sp. MW-13]|nr:hypothetical protein C5N14_03975 [Micromonospora sp. MW-13]